jgi:hypothetical protein
MKKLLSSVTVMSMIFGLGIVSASAQGLPAGAMSSVYGSSWTAKQLQARNLNASHEEQGGSKAKQMATPDVSQPDSRMSGATVSKG